MAKFIIESVDNPRYSLADHSMIDCTVKFAHVPGAVQFSASPIDTEEHGRMIYESCVAGDYGNIAEYEESN